MLFMSIFYADPCEDAVCRIHHFCHYSDGYDACNCTNPWNGTDCASNEQYGKILDPAI